MDFTDDQMKPKDYIELEDYYPISDDYYVAKDEGHQVQDNVAHTELEDCKSMCEKNSNCNSITWCPLDNNRCYMYDMKLIKTTPTRYHGYCTSYYHHALNQDTCYTNSDCSSGACDTNTNLCYMREPDRYCTGTQIMYDISSFTEAIDLCNQDSRCGCINDGENDGVYSTRVGTSTAPEDKYDDTCWVKS